MRATISVVAAVAVLVLAGCSSQPVEPPVASSPTDSCRGSGCSLTYEGPPTPTAAPSAVVGQTVTNGGITLTVTKAHSVDSIQMNEGTSDRALAMRSTRRRQPRTAADSSR